jgi:hypothetical protein
MGIGRSQFNGAFTGRRGTFFRQLNRGPAHLPEIDASDDEPARSANSNPAPRPLPPPWRRSPSTSRQLSALG